MKVFNVNYEIFSKNACKSKLVVLGDLHGWVDNAQIGRIVNNIKDEKPDIIMLAGDILTESNKWLEKATLIKVANLLRNLSEDGADVITVLGNHDTHFVNEKLLSNYYSIGDIEHVHPLFNDSVNISRNGENIHIAGFVSDARDGVTAFTNRFAKKNGVDQRPQRIIQTLEPLLDLNQDEVNILLAHDPRQLRMPQVDEATKDFDLRIAAHIHNGYLPFKKTTADKKYVDQDCQHYIFMGKPPLKARNFARGVAYGNGDFYILCTQTGDYYLVRYNENIKDNEYIEISSNQAEELIINRNLTPSVITGGVNRYLGIPFEGSEVTTVKMKKINPKKHRY